MVSLHIALLLIWIHFVADFIFQSNYTAINKSKDNYVLLYHVILYGILFIPFSIQYAFLNAALHFGVDYITSRVTSILYRHDERHWFFITIGLDQAIHISTLLITYQLMFPTI